MLDVQSACECVYLVQEQSRSTHMNSLGVSDLQGIIGCLLLLYQMAKQHESAIISNFTCLNSQNTDCNSVRIYWSLPCDNSSLIVHVTMQSRPWLQCLCVSSLVSMCHVYGFIMYNYSMYHNSTMIVFLKVFCVQFCPVAGNIFWD